MTTNQAKRLAKVMKRGGCSARVSKNQIIFSGLDGEHSLDLRVSTLDRVLAHWRGFCGNNGAEVEVKRGGTVAWITGSGKLFIGRVGRPGRRAGVRGYWIHRLYVAENRASVTPSGFSSYTKITEEVL